MGLWESVPGRFHRIRQAYAPHEDRPLAGYAKALGVYGAVVGGVGLAIRLARRPIPDRIAVGDVVLLSLATHKLSRLLTKDAVTSPLRAPFTRYEKPIGGGEVAEEVRDSGSGSRHAFGEMVSCPFCVAVWIATAMTSGLVIAPRPTRLLATCFTVVAASDFLQMAYAAARHVDSGYVQAFGPAPIGKAGGES